MNRTLAPRDAEIAHLAPLAHHARTSARASAHAAHASRGISARSAAYLVRLLPARLTLLAAALCTARLYLALMHCAVAARRSALLPRLAISFLRAAHLRGRAEARARARLAHMRTQYQYLRSWGGWRYAWHITTISIASAPVAAGAGILRAVRAAYQVAQSNTQGGGRCRYRGCWRTRCDPLESNRKHQWHINTLLEAVAGVGGNGTSKADRGISFALMEKRCRCYALADINSRFRHLT